MCCVTLRVIRDLQHDKGILEVKLVSVPLDTALGGLKGSDSFFEIYTESMVIDLLLYKELEPDLQLLPEVFGDILRLSDKG
jgi:hypothetical protein